MKRSSSIPANLLTLLTCVLSMLCILLSSCVKSTPDASSALTPTALLTVIQASPDEPPLSFYLNGDPVNQSPLDYGYGLDYFTAYAGGRTAYFYGQSMSLILQAQITLQPNNAYSLFLDNVATKPGTLLLTDTLNKPASGYAGVRFVDLSPDAPAVDLAVQGGPVMVSNRSFQGYSSFLPIAAKSNYTFQIRLAGKSTVLATLPDVAMTSGYVYTIVFEGLATPTNSTDKLNPILITNAEF